MPGGFSQRGLYDIALAGTNVWAVGYNGHDPDIALRSGNRGVTWNLVSLPTGGWVAKCASFPDPAHGWVAGDYGMIMRTIDGGSTWGRLPRPTDKDLVAVDFLNEQVGYIAGREHGFDRATNKLVNGAVVLRTIDGGNTWRKCYEDDHSQYLTLYALSENYVFVHADEDLVSEDAGANWQRLDTDSPAYAVFTDDGIGHGVGYNRPGFSTSYDGGKSWQKIPGLPEPIMRAKWNSVDFADRNRGLAVGDNGAGAATNDGGKTWQFVKSGTNDYLMKVKPNTQTGFVLVLGQNGVYRVEGF